MQTIKEKKEQKEARHILMLKMSIMRPHVFHFIYVGWLWCFKYHVCLVIGVTIWRDTRAYGYSSPFTSLKELVFGPWSFFSSASANFGSQYGSLYCGNMQEMQQFLHASSRFWIESVWFWALANQSGGRMLVQIFRANEML